MRLRRFRHFRSNLQIGGVRLETTRPLSETEIMNKKAAFEMAQYNEAQSKIMMEMELLVKDTFNRMNSSCVKKCSNHKYDQSDLVKSEAVCLDRCVAKYMEFHDMMGKALSRDKETFEQLASSPVWQKNDADST